MNAGLPRRAQAGGALDRTDFFLGCVVTNHKRHEREVMPQYFKLRKKARAGRGFVIKQIGWNARKDDELLRFIRREQLDLHAWRTSTSSRAVRRASFAPEGSRASS